MKYIFLSLLACMFIACEQPASSVDSEKENPVSETPNKEKKVEKTTAFDPQQAVDRIKNLKAESEVITEDKAGGGDCDITYQRLAQNKKVATKESQDQLTVVTTECYDYGKEIKTLLTDKDNKPILLHFLDKDVAESGSDNYLLNEYIIDLAGNKWVYMRSSTLDEGMSISDDILFKMNPNPDFKVAELLEEMKMAK